MKDFACQKNKKESAIVCKSFNIIQDPIDNQYPTFSH